MNARHVRGVIAITVVVITAALMLWREPGRARVPRVDVAALAFLATVTRAPTASETLSVSPDGRYAVRSDSVGYATQSITVTDISTGQMVPVITIREADPGSGRSHRLAWSHDSRALLILGSGSRGGGPPAPLCLVYRMAGDDLLTTDPCPTPTTVVRP